MGTTLLHICVCLHLLLSQFIPLNASWTKSWRCPTLTLSLAMGISHPLVSSMGSSNERLLCKYRMLQSVICCLSEWIWTTGNFPSTELQRKKIISESSCNEWNMERWGKCRQSSAVWLGRGHRGNLGTCSGSQQLIWANSGLWFSISRDKLLTPLLLPLCHHLPQGWA